MPGAARVEVLERLGLVGVSGNPVGVRGCELPAKLVGDLECGGRAGAGVQAQKTTDDVLDRPRHVGAMGVDRRDRALLKQPGHLVRASGGAGSSRDEPARDQQVRQCPHREEVCSMIYGRLS